MAETNAQRLLGALNAMTRPYTRNGYRYQDIEATATEGAITFRMRVRSGPSANDPIIFDSFDPAEKRFTHLAVVNPRVNIDDGADANGNRINVREDLEEAIRIELERFLQRKLGHA